MKYRIMALVAAAFVAVSATAAYPQQTQQRLSISQVDQRLSNQGFRVIEVEWDDGHYEVTAFNAANQCRELDVNPSTGAVTRDRPEDDCYDDQNRNRTGAPAGTTNGNR